MVKGNEFKGSEFKGNKFKKNQKSFIVERVAGKKSVGKEVTEFVAVVVLNSQEPKMTRSKLKEVVEKGGVSKSSAFLLHLPLAQGAAPTSALGGSDRTLGTAGAVPGEV